MTACNVSAADRNLKIGVFIWGVLCLLIVLLLFQKRLQPFDPEARLLNAFSDVNEYLLALDTALSSDSLPTGPMTLVRVIDSDCSCNRATVAHWETMLRQFDEVQFLEVELKKLPFSAQGLIPSTPMALFWSDENRLTYAGPFSSGALCNAENSLVDAYAAGLTVQPFAPFQTEGCFCSTPRV